jgi:hypothetical protein
MAGMKKDNSVEIMIWVMGGITLVLCLVVLVILLQMLW